MIRGENAQVLHNLRQGLLSQLPRGPVRELRMYAPFVDRTGEALAEVIDGVRPRPRRSSDCKST